MGNLHAKQQALKQRIKRRNSDPSAYFEKRPSIRRPSRLLRSSPVLPYLAMNARERAIVSESWQALNSKDCGLMNTIISDAWLHAAERSPVWLWGLVGIDEAMQSDAAKNPKFLAIVNEVRQFLHLLIKTHHLDADAVRDQSYKLGVRHRNYMDLGHQAAYWDSFARCFSDSVITHAYQKKATSAVALCDDLPSPSTTIKPKRSFRQSFSRAARLSKPDVLTRQNSASAETLTVVKNKRSKSLAPFNDSHRLRCSSIDGQPQEVAHVADAWYKLMRNIVDAMRSGYTGEVGPVRLSLTSSILSLSSLRSGRSRASTRQHSPRPSEGQIDQNHYRSTSPLRRRRSIFRTPSPRNSLEINALRRLSSPRHSLNPDTDLNCFITPPNYYMDGRQDSVGSSGSNASSRGGVQSSPARGPNVQSLAPYTARQCSLRRKPLVEALTRNHFKVTSKNTRDNDCV